MTINEINIYDVVALVAPRPGLNLAVGARGTVLLVFETPNAAYEVEFLDSAGNTIACVTLEPGEIEKV